MNNPTPPQQPITDALQTKCSACGGYVHYSPREQKLKCVYCGKTDELDLTPVEIEENDFNEWKDKSDDNLDEQTQEINEIKCRQCGANTSLAPNTSAAKCVFCGTPLIMNEAAVKRFWQPEYMLPFKVDEKMCRENFNKWIGKKWFIPSKLKKENISTDTFKGVYLPFWTYDANTQTVYTGERGENRTESSRNDKGEEVKRTVTDWYPTSGEVSVEFDDVLVPAAKSLPPHIMSQLTNFDMMNCVGYRKEFMAGFIAEIYQTDFREGLPIAKQKMEAIIEDKINNDIGGDKQRITRKNILYNDLMFKLLMLPIWISAFRFDGKLYQFVINGRTGQVIGDYPKDKMKVFLVVLGIVLLLGLMIWFITSRG